MKHDVLNLGPKPYRPVATRVGRLLIYPGGHMERISRWEQFLFATGLKTTTTRKESR